MCGCADLKYAKKNHVHNYAKPSDVADFQAQIDALIATHATDVADLQTQIDALTTTHATDVADLQTQIDALQQELDDCCGCVGWAEEFDVDLGGATIDTPSDWFLSYSSSAQRLRAIRDNGAEFPIAKVMLDVPNIKMVSGMTLDASTRNDNNISHSIFWVTHNGQETQVYTDNSPSGSDVPVSIDLSQDIPIGDIITRVAFTAYAEDGTAITYARWYLNYVRLVCPS